MDPKLEKVLQELTDAVAELKAHAEWVGAPSGYGWDYFQPMMGRAEDAPENRGWSTLEYFPLLALN